MGVASGLRPGCVPRPEHGRERQTLQIFESLTAAFSPMLRPIHSDQILKEALRLQERGELQAAHRLYFDILSRDPKNSRALFQMGVLYGQTGNIEAALEYFEKACQKDKKNPLAYFNKGLALARIGRHEDALASYDQAIQLQPGFIDALFNKGVTELNLRRLEGAISSLTRVTALDPKHVNAHSTLGVALQFIGRPEASRRHFETALSLAPDSPDVLCNFGFVLCEQRDYEPAQTLLRRAIERQPVHPEAHHNLGVVYYHLNQMPLALECCERALAQRPAFTDALAWKGRVLAESGRLDEALSCFDAALKIDPHHAESLHDRSLYQLQAMNFSEGWKGMPQRWKMRNFRSRPLVSPQPTWNGRSSVTRLLVWGEQGIGDQILYARFLPHLEIDGELIFSTKSKLVALLTRSLATHRCKKLSVVSDEAGPPDPRSYDEHVSIADLGARLVPDVAAVLQYSSPYLQADPATTQSLRARLPGNKKICGISWRSTNAEIGDDKSARLQDLAPLLALPDWHFVDLQYGDTLAEREALRAQDGLSVHKFDDVDNFDDLDRLCALIDACDLVVTVSNTTAHLAGALGKRTLLMQAHQKGRLWYWHHLNQQSIWYPCITLFQQRTFADWSDPVAQIRAHMESL